GPLLLPGLLAAAAHLAARLGRGRTGAASRHLHPDDVREQTPTERLREDRAGKLDRPGAALRLRDDGRADVCDLLRLSHHSAPAAFFVLAAAPRCFRMTIVPPFAPGTAPRRKIRSWSP